MPSYRDPLPGPGPRRPSPARVYDALLGGKDNFAVDREAAQRLTSLAPETPLAIRANRAFLARAVRFVAEQGVHQFVDLGSGLPTSPNVHEVALAVHDDASVVYVDNDPVVAAYGRAVNVTRHAEVVQADLREPADIIRKSELIDFNAPVGVLAVAVLHFLDDQEVDHLLGTFRASMVSGSYLTISHGSAGTRKDVDQVVENYSTEVSQLYLRTTDEVRELFVGCELVDPGVVPVQEWRPERSLSAVGPVETPHGEVVAGVARVP